MPFLPPALSHDGRERACIVNRYYFPLPLPFPDGAGEAALLLVLNCPAEIPPLLGLDLLLE